MSSNRTLMVLPGDGVGPEVVNETLRVVDWFAKNKGRTNLGGDASEVMILDQDKFKKKFIRDFREFKTDS